MHGTALKNVPAGYDREHAPNGLPNWEKHHHYFGANTIPLRIDGAAIAGYDREHPQAEYLKFKSWYLEYPIRDAALDNAELKISAWINASNSAFAALYSALCA